MMTRSTDFANQVPRAKGPRLITRMVLWCVTTRLLQKTAVALKDSASPAERGVRELVLREYERRKGAEAANALRRQVQR